MAGPWLRTTSGGWVRADQVIEVVWIDTHDPVSLHEFVDVGPTWLAVVVRLSVPERGIVTGGFVELSPAERIVALVPSVAEAESLVDGLVAALSTYSEPDWLMQVRADEVLVIHPRQLATITVGGSVRPDRKGRERVNEATVSRAQ